MRLVILGAGAIGGVVAGYFARAKRDVLLLARGEHLAAIRANGLRVEAPDGAFTVRVAVAESTAPIEWRDDDVVIIAVKTQDVAAALCDLGAPAHVPIVCMTNGVEAERIALRHAREVYGACVLMPASYLVAGTVQVWAAPVPGLFELGRYPDGTDRADAIAGELVAAGFDVVVRPNVMKWKRGKLLANLANGAEAISGSDARRSVLSDRAKAEARACYAAANLSCITEAEDAERRKALVNLPIDGAKRPGGSTWQSLARGHGTLETDYLNGEIVLLGRLHGVPTPVNEALQELAAEAARTRAAAGALPLAELIARVDAHRRT
ncbi:MAG TPA: 2-dehydropantoate 2-reductase N-terminal domain-containing protein [Kofleriaceae bacterium]|nr:2-dehydropantoate 2-reductase N-terminal domain-containing protein [Kofleriaceae bacterium]